MNIGNKTSESVIISNKGKKIIVEEDVPQYWFPTEIWDNIKGFMLDHPDIHFTNLAVTSDNLDFKYGLENLEFEEGYKKEVRALLGSFKRQFTIQNKKYWYEKNNHILLLATKSQWKPKVRLLCEYMLNFARESRKKATENEREIIRRRRTKPYDYAEYQREHPVTDRMLEEDKKFREKIQLFYDIYALVTK
jgi:hypothetical protein